MSNVLGSEGPRSVRRRIFRVCAILVLANLLTWTWALAVLGGHPVLLGTAVLAYSLGLRHALDADHIAAIDNVTRKLMQEGKQPVTVGLFFALGHSTVVVVASVIIALATHTLRNEFVPFRELGGVIGTSASASFLLLIAVANLITLRGVYRAFQQVRRGGNLTAAEIDIILQQRGWLARLFRPLFRFASRSWHLYPIGLLFALGFETASEISLFGVSAQTSEELSGFSVLIYPALFTAGMTLIDTTDGLLMLGAYGWAYLNPIRKLFYNLTITSVSVVVAFIIGGIEALGLLADHFGLQGSVWRLIAGLNENLGMLGYGIVALFIASWGISVAVYRLKNYERRGENVRPL